MKYDIEYKQGNEKKNKKRIEFGKIKILTIKKKQPKSHSEISNSVNSLGGVSLVWW